jgi:hypothetical protein
MGLLDKVETKEEVVKKAKPAAKAAKAVAKKATPAPKKEAKAKKVKAKKARPEGLSSEFEIASSLNRVIAWWVNFTVNFALLIGALVMSVTTGGASGGFATTLLFLGAGLIFIFNGVVLPTWTGRNLGQYTSSTRYIRGDGSKPLFLHGLFVNNIGVSSLIGFIMVFTQAGKVSDGGAPIAFTSIGAILMILWIVNWQFSRNSDLRQGLFDLMFGAYLVRYVSEEGETSGFRARLESMSQFGEKYAQRVEDKKKAKEVASKEKKEEKSDSNSDD